MIKIERNNLDQIAEEHFQELRPKLKKKIQHFLKKYKPKRLSSFKKFYQMLTFIDQQLRSILIGSPELLQEYTKLSLLNICYYDSKSLSSEEQKVLNDLKEIFDYKNFSNTKKKEYNALNLEEKLALNVCPYCNRNYIYPVRKRRTSELDHFFPKNKYPYLALSFYNLIPSCKVCNQIKSTSPLPYNPYQKDLNQVTRFRYSFKDINAINNIEDLMVDLEVKAEHQNDEELQRKLKSQKDVLKLGPLYDAHKDIVLELIQKAQIYNETYIDELLQNYEGVVFKNREDLLRLITSGYITDQDIEKRPLSKLIKDISEQLDLI